MQWNCSSQATKEVPTLHRKHNTGYKIPPVPVEYAAKYRYDGYDSSGDTVCYNLFPYMDEYPSPLYVAPFKDGVPYMTRKVLVKK